MLKNSRDCDIEQPLLCCKMRLKPKKCHHSKPEGQPCIYHCKMQHLEKVEEFTRSFEESMSNCMASVDSVTNKWDQLHEAIHSTALTTFGKRLSKSNYWFETKSNMITPIIVAKQNALTEYKCLPNEESLQVLRNTENKVQQIVKHCTIDCWHELSKNIQNTAASCNTREKYDGITKALDPTQSKAVTLKSVTSE